ncbi:hypothetical protein BT69DRAFT_1322376 [Atractiella rhizophila]|nr:hypothetical protein BT69DRAFT_1322376 [Atractiella rhizophila]
MDQAFFMLRDKSNLTQVGAGFPPVTSEELEVVKNDPLYREFTERAKDFKFNARDINTELTPLLPSPKPIKLKLPEAAIPVEWEQFSDPPDPLPNQVSFDIPDVPDEPVPSPPLISDHPSESMNRVFNSVYSQIPPLDDRLLEPLPEPSTEHMQDLERYFIKGKHAGLGSIIGSKRLGKAMSTREWKSVWDERKSVHVWDNIEKMKKDKLWSFSQPKKQELPKCRKTHWDYLLDEMEWLQTDFKMERRQKMADASRLANAARLYRYLSPAQRITCGVAFVPSQIPSRTDGEEVEEDVDMDLGDTSVEDQIMQSLFLSENQKAKKALSADQIQFCRSSIFNLPQACTTISQHDLDVSGLPEDLQGITLSELFPDLPLYGPPDSSPTSLVAAEKLDPSDIRHSKMFPLNPLLGDKNWLLSTLHPSTNVEGGKWKDLSQLAGSSPPYSTVLIDESFGKRDPLQGKGNSKNLSCALFLPKGRQNVAASSVLFTIPEQPAEDVVARAQQLGWTDPEDNMLFKLVLTYSPNWTLIADLFNASSARVPTDKRTAWDIFDRFNKRYPGHAASMISGIVHSMRNGRETRERSNTGATNRLSVPPISMDLQTSTSGHPGSISTRSATAAANAASSSRDIVMPPVPGSQGDRKSKRHEGIIEVIKKKGKERETKKKPANRRINLSAHDSHAYSVPQKAFFFNPALWSKFKQQQEVRRQQELIHQLHQAQAQHHAAQQAAAAQQLQQQQQQQQQQHQGPLPQGPSANGTPNQHPAAPLQPPPGQPPVPGAPPPMNGPQRMLQNQGIQQLSSPQSPRASPFPGNIAQSVPGPSPSTVQGVPNPAMFRGAAPPGTRGPLTPVQSATVIHNGNISHQPPMSSPP